LYLQALLAAVEVHIFAQVFHSIDHLLKEDSLLKVSLENHHWTSVVKKRKKLESYVQI